jgi:hypothetical protein
MTDPESGKRQRAAFEAVPESEKDAYCASVDAFWQIEPPSNQY